MTNRQTSISTNEVKLEDTLLYCKAVEFMLKIYTLLHFFFAFVKRPFIPGIW